MPTVDDVIALAATLRRVGEPWEQFVRRAGVKTVTPKTLGRWEARQYKKPREGSVTGVYAELQSFQQRAPPTSLVAKSPEDRIMDGRRNRALEQLRNFLEDLDTKEELRAAVKGAMDGVDAYHRGRLQGPDNHEHAPPGHKARS